MWSIAYNLIPPHLVGGGGVDTCIVCTPLLDFPPPPPPLTSVLASSGIDYNVKLWEPVSQDPCSLDDLDEVIQLATSCA